MSDIEITCPSGLVFGARRMYGGAYQAMAKVVERGTQLEAAAHGLAACAEEIINPGPYGNTPGTKPSVEFWKHGWAVDLMVASIDLRIQSFSRDPTVGKQLPVTFNCQRCGKLTDNWLIDDIGIYLRMPRLRRMPLKTREIVTQRGRFDTKVDGKTVRFDIQRLKQDIEMRDLLKRNMPGQRQLTPVEIVAKQLTFVEGLKAQNMLNIWRWCSNQDAEVLDELLALFYQTEGTLDSTTRVTCQNPDCGIEQDIQLPFGGKAFWSPKRAKAEEGIWTRELTETDETAEQTETAEKGEQKSEEQQESRTAS
jgi:hypothetical protein